MVSYGPVSGSYSGSVRYSVFMHGSGRGQVSRGLVRRALSRCGKIQKRGIKNTPLFKIYFYENSANSFINYCNRLYNLFIST